MDTPLSESRFADMLEGWVEEEREVHDEHDTHSLDSHGHDDEHDDEHDGEHDHENDDDDQIANSQEEHEDEGIHFRMESLHVQLERFKIIAQFTDLKMKNTQNYAWVLFRKLISY